MMKQTNIHTKNTVWASGEITILGAQLLTLTMTRNEMSFDPRSRKVETVDIGQLMKENWCEEKIIWIRQA